MALKRFHPIDEGKYDRRYCDVCGKPLPASNKDSVCKECKEDAIYKQVKEYVLHNDVTEFELADKFGLSIDAIRRWIREGHLSYRDLK